MAGKIEAIKNMYGIENLDNNNTQKVGDVVIVGWCVDECKTLKDLESKYSDSEIEMLYNDLHS